MSNNLRSQAPVTPPHQVDADLINPRPTMGREASGGGALELYTKFASGVKSPVVCSEKAVIRAQSRRRKFNRVANSGVLLPGHRVAKCGRVPRAGCKREVWVHAPEEDGQGWRAHFAGFITCGSVWVCPVCAAKITERRRQEIAQALDNFAGMKFVVDGEEGQGSVVMVTFTFQHTKYDHLVQLRDALNRAYRSLKSGRWWQEFEQKYHLVGSIAGHELTVSRRFGWHPHKHTLFLSELPASKIDREEVERELSARFQAIMATMGRYSSSIYGVMVGEVTTCKEGENEEIYIAKWGLASELAKNPVKKGTEEQGEKHYSPFELLDIALETPWAADMFIEYADAMKGVKQLVWSRGLRDKLGIKAPEKSDEELADEQVETGDILLYSFSREEWKTIIYHDKRADILEVAELGDPIKFMDFMGELKKMYPYDNSS